MKNLGKQIRFYWNKWMKKKMIIMDAKEAGISVNVHKLNDESYYLHESLGISNERVDEMARLIKKTLIDSKCVTTIMETVSKELTHPNELMFAVWILRNIMDDHNNSHPLHGLFEMLMKKKGE